ncbi:nuclear transport factor 2 family protein [Teredinibacter sp. KSP-S5-2]|uniref:nuclear transport factor 2 family protein n=1 Tax=Teredinibacter sp. KSP-S5-2 TaxID=3034506 RepID=UPI0029344884|nr:hypothetical protein [Teredinibacter sp. KSP-S5-2]WNO08257.1 hypothetical protein P5V12_14900 [Teredinibacter sp. KSP-S5-2]
MNRGPLFLFLLITLLTSCSKPNINQNQAFIQALTTHIEAIQTANFDQLASTLPTDEKLHWVKTDGERVQELNDFLDPHKEWFANYPIDMTYKIVHWEAGEKLGYAGVHMIYKSIDEKGVAHSDLVEVSYVLKKFDTDWKVVLDHATAVKKPVSDNS